MRRLGIVALAVGVVLPWVAATAWLRLQKVPDTVHELRPEMVELPPGKFLMGSPPDEEGHEGDEALHPVTLNWGFAMAQTEVTQDQYREVTGQDPSQFKGGNRPVERVSWYDAIKYCNALSRREELVPCYQGEGEKTTWDPQCTGYRLPTEAEWEYAARANTRLVYSGSDDPAKVAWFGEGAEGQTHPVRGKDPNGWGLYDMSGNVYEWVWDWYDVKYPSSSTDPTGPTAGPRRVSRGGSFWYEARYVRAANRDRNSPAFAIVFLGFRVARSLPSSH